jgi:hypothetical protein
VGAAKRIRAEVGLFELITHEALDAIGNRKVLSAMGWKSLKQPRSVS